MVQRLTSVLFHKMTSPQAQDGCSVGAKGAQERQSIPCFVEDVFVQAVEIWKKNN